MKEELNAFDILAISTEMQPLVGGYLDKVFNWDSKNVLLRTNSSEGKKEVYIQDLKWLYIAPEKPEVPDIPSQFAVNLRKHISNAKIVGVDQKEFDRIVVIELQKEKQFQLVIELFGEGNVILVSEGRVVNSIVSRKYRHREVRPGAEYSFPLPRFNPRSMDPESFQKALLSSTSDVVRTLATSINIGGQYAEETCLRAGVEKSRKAKSLSEEEVGLLFESLSQLVSQVQSSRDPGIVIENDTMVDATPIPLQQYQDAEFKRYPTFSDAIHDFLPALGPDMKEVQDSELARLERQTDQQKEAIDRLLQESKDYAAKAELLYSNYAEVEALSSALREASPSTWEQLRETASKSPLFKDIRPAESTVVVEIGGEAVPVDYRLGVESNASALYEKAKEVKEKSSGAAQALSDTEEKIEKRRKGLEKVRAAKREVKKTKEFWFERYKWFITSGGKLVLAGRDAHSNDQLVKKHLKPSDRFAHADIHGAPSVVILEGAQALEEELREACIFALAHSKAWNAGATEGSAYWVLPDQVSKTPAPGEFVPRGAFIIRGKRNYFYHLPLELAVGEITYEGERKIMCGPLESVSVRSERYAIIAPGKEDRSAVSGRLARSFEVPEEEISRILPPGNLEIRESVALELSD